MRSCRSILVALLLASSSAAPACAIFSSDSDSSESAIVAEARAVRMLRLQESIEPVFVPAATDPGEVGQTVRATVSDRDVTFSPNVDRQAAYNAVRGAVVALGKNEISRRLMVDSSIRALSRRSNALKGLLEQAGTGARPDNANVYDELVIGMGPVGVSYTQAMTDLKPEARILAVEATARPGGTFAEVGDAFSLNSTNRANTGTRAKPGQGDLNFVMDMWGLPDFQSQKWAPAGSLGDVAAVGADLSSADALLSTRVVSVREIPNAPATRNRRYAVELDLGDGKKSTVYVDRIVNATGIGKETVPISDGPTLELLAEETARAESEVGYTPKVQTFTRLVNTIGQSQNPYRPFAGKTIAVVGGGDSGKVINEFFFRLGPQGAYGLDTAQVGNVKKVYWIGVDFETCQDYIAKARGRYAALQSALNSGLLVPVPSKVGALARSGDGVFVKTNLASNIRTTSGSNIGPSYGTGTIEGVAYRKVDPSTKQAEGRWTVEDPTLDYVVLSTGFKSEAEKVFEPILGENADLANLLQPVRGQPDGFDAPVDIATRLETNAASTGGGKPQEIYFVGSANEVRGGLPQSDELARVNANTVSLFTNVARTRSLAAMNARTLEKMALSTPEILRKVPKSAQLQLADKPLERTGAPVNPTGKPTKMTANPDLEIRVLFAGIMDKLDVPAGTTLHVKIDGFASRKTAGTKYDDTLFVKVPELDEAGEKAIATAIEANPRLIDVLSAYIDPRNRVSTIEISIPTTRSASSVTGRPEVKKADIKVSTSS